MTTSNSAESAAARGTKRSTPVSSPSQDDLAAHSVKARLRQIWSSWEALVWSLPSWMFAPEPLELDEHHEQWKEIHSEASKTVRRVFLSLLAICLFCVLTLGGSSDLQLLLEVVPTVTLPLINYKVSFPVFLIVAPLLLMALTFYLHVFVIHTRKFRLPPEERAPILPNMDSFPAQCITWILYYWLTPITLAYFAWKAKPHELHGAILFWVTLGFFFILLLLQARRTSKVWRPYVLPLLAVIALLASAGFPWLMGKRHMVISAQEFEEKLSAQKFEEKYLAELKRVSLVRAVARGLILSNKELGDVNFTGAILDGSDFSEAKLISSNFDEGSLLDASFLKAIMTQATLNKADLEGADFSGAHLSFAELRSANLPEVKLVSADLRNAFLNGAYLGSADLSYATLNQAWLTPLETPSKITSTILSSATLKCSSLYEADLSESLIDDADLTDADLRRATFTAAKLRGATLDGADLSEAILDGADLSGASLRETVLIATSFKGVSGLEQEQLQGACGDGDTVLPKDLAVEPCAADIIRMAADGDSLVLSRCEK